ncbi:MAG: hypothetical protein K0S47_1293 [Herbinix sp.]|jgi:diguanylate cyclase (GGDEF)-like protein|nr:hypothetical protein [Herbinix sp.]
MKEFEQIYERWRKKLLHTNTLLAMLLFLVEVFMFFLLGWIDLIEQPTLEYLLSFLIIPTIINIFILYSGNVIMKHMRSDSKYINYIPILQLATICMTIACTHNIFSVTLSLFCFPLFATILFSDKRMTRIIGIVCFVYMIITFSVRRFSVYRPKNDKYFMADIIVTTAIFCATFILCNVLIRFVEEKTNMIHQGYLKQIEMKELLNRDQKTGLYGHTFFMNTLERMVELANNTLKTFAVAVIDIDDFKKVNDVYGHLKGDQIIITLSNLMKKYFNEDQFIARYGGEEFAIIFSTNELSHGIELLEKHRTEFEAQNYNFMKEKITISIGIALWQPGWTAEQIFEAADSAMYTSKLNGKNRTKMYENCLEFSS